MPWVLRLKPHEGPRLRRTHVREKTSDFSGGTVLTPHTTPAPTHGFFTYALNVAAPAIHVPDGELGIRGAWTPRFEPHSSALPVPLHVLGVGLLVRLLQIAGGLLTMACVPRSSYLNLFLYASAKHPLPPL